MRAQPNPDQKLSLMDVSPPGCTDVTPSIHPSIKVISTTCCKELRSLSGLHKKLCSIGLGEPRQGQGRREPPLISIYVLGEFSISSVFLIYIPSFITYNYASSVTGIGTEDKV